MRLVGVGNPRMDSTNSLVGRTPEADTVKPMKLTSSSANWNLVGFKTTPLLPEMSRKRQALKKAASMVWSNRRVSSIHRRLFSTPSSSLSILSV